MCYPQEVIFMIGVRSLASIYSESSLCFGNKAINLSKIISCMPDVDCILPGFCVTFDLHMDISDQLEIFKPDISKRYQNLLKSTGYSNVVVRSSADYEDSRIALFPGVFKSFTGVANISSLLSSIKECVRYASTSTVKQYSSLHNNDIPIVYFTVIVQVELKSEYAGIAFSMLPLTYYNDTMVVQLTCGDNHNLVKGIGQSNTYSLFGNQSKIVYRLLDQMISVDQPIECNILETLFQLMLRLKVIFQDQLDVEWGYAEGKLYIYQARFLKTVEKPYSSDKTVSVFKKNAKQGLKYQAMSFFVENKLFHNEVFFFTKGTSVSEIRQTLLTKVENTPVTVRFSCRQDIGLPRVFADSPVDAVNKIAKLKQDDWSVIVYRSLNVEGSFELYLDKEKTILEYVPGIWESDSHLMTDVALMTENNSYFWLINDDRVAKFEDSAGESRRSIHPTSITEAVYRFKAFLPTIKKLRLLFENDFPINFHFITDGRQIDFLNCRLSKKFDWRICADSIFFPIKKLSDCASWDGHSAILFSPELARGEEVNIAAFIPFLTNVDVPIFVDFGILSHPAIMLREFGITVLPRFNNHSCHIVSNTMLNN